LHGKTHYALRNRIAVWQIAISDTTQPFVEPATGTTFPPMLGKWKRGQDRDYGPAGESVSPTIPRPGRSDGDHLYLRLGLKDIPTGTTSRVVKDAFAETKCEIDEAMQQRGGSARELAEGVVSLGAAPGRAQGAAGELRGRRQCRPGRNVRRLSDRLQEPVSQAPLTYPKERLVEHQAQIKSLLSDLDALLRK